MLPESYLFLESQLVRKSRPQTQRAGGVDYEGGACALGDENVWDRQMTSLGLWVGRG